MKSNHFTYQSIQSKTGKLWLDRNIGAILPAPPYLPQKNNGYRFYHPFDLGFLSQSIPEGFRLPTINEWAEEIGSWSSPHTDKLMPPHIRYYWIQTSKRVRQTQIYDIQKNKLITLSIFTPFPCLARCIQNL